MNINPSENFVTQILKKITPIIGAELLLEPDYQYTGMITFKNGKKVFYRNTRFNINPLGSVEVAKDKNYASFFLKHFGFNVPYGQSFFSENLNTNLAIKRTIDDGYEYAKKIGFPVILKPNNLSQGLFVTKVYGKTDYYKTAKKILKNNLTPKYPTRFELPHRQIFFQMSLPSVLRKKKKNYLCPLI